MNKLDLQFSEERLGSISYESIATLADEPDGLTCSVNAAREWGDDSSQCYAIRGYSTYEEAAESVLEGQNETLLVAGAYPNIKNFFFNPELVAVEARVMTLPDFVLAFPGEQKEAAETLYHHSATALLASQVSVTYNTTQTAGTNSEVARLAKSDNESAAITNVLCADHYELTIADVLTKDKSQTFTLFKKGGGYQRTK